MSGTSTIRLHAIYAVLDELPLFEASIASIYPHVDRITVITTYDQDWMGQHRDPSEIVPAILERGLDPDRKIDLLVATETNEARARNRAMDFAAPRRASISVRRQHADDEPLDPPDYFLIIDSDEIYEADAIERIKRHVATDRRPYYRIPCVRYFRSWNYRIDGHEWAISLVRADKRLPFLRRRYVSLPRRAAARLPLVPQALRERLLGYVDVSPEVGVFHHGSYVGPRQRIAAKLASFGHASEVVPDWLETVWDPWTPESRNFNPTHPWLFPSAARVASSELPREINARAWSSDYLDA